MLETLDMFFLGWFHMIENFPHLLAFFERKISTSLWERFQVNGMGNSFNYTNSKLHVSHSNVSFWIFFFFQMIREVGAIIWVPEGSCLWRVHGDVYRSPERSQHGGPSSGQARCHQVSIGVEKFHTLSELGTKTHMARRTNQLCFFISIIWEKAAKIIGGLKVWLRSPHRGGERDEKVTCCDVPAGMEYQGWNVSGKTDLTKGMRRVLLSRKHSFDCDTVVSICVIPKRTSKGPVDPVNCWIHRIH